MTDRDPLWEAVDIGLRIEGQCNELRRALRMATTELEQARESLREAMDDRDAAVVALSECRAELADCKADLRRSESETSHLLDAGALTDAELVDATTALGEARLHLSQARTELAEYKRRNAAAEKVLVQSAKYVLLTYGPTEQSNKIAAEELFAIDILMGVVMGPEVGT